MGYFKNLAANIASVSNIKEENNEQVLIRDDSWAKQLDAQRGEETVWHLSPKKILDNPPYLGK